MRDWYNTGPLSATADGQSASITWAMLLSNWIAIELDLADRGIDVESGVLRERTWRWLELRIVDLIGSGGRLARALSKPA